MKTCSFFLPVVAGFGLFSSAMAVQVSDQTPSPLTPAPASVDSSVSVAPSPKRAPQNASVHTGGATEIVKMHDAGLEPSVIRAYVQNLRVPYKATADDILYLHQNKVGDDLIADWIKRGGELVTLAAQVPASSPDLVASANTQSGPPMVMQQQPPVVYQGAPQVATAPTVVYSSPGYAYSDAYADPYYYGAPLAVGFSWGLGSPYWGWGGYRGGYYHGGPAYRAGFGGHFGGSHFVGHPGGFGGGSHFGGGGGHHR